jgi:hypothetical protein
MKNNLFFRHVLPNGGTARPGNGAALVPTRRRRERQSNAATRIRRHRKRA